jgi:hypothetical protein
MTENLAPQPKRSRSPALLWAAAILALALLWWGVFHLVGKMWWNAAQPTGQRPPPPAALHPKLPHTGWVDLGKYSRDHPVWEPAQE